MLNDMHKQPKILVADDDEMTRYLLRQTFENKGYQIIEATNGLECLEQFKTHDPEMILLDAMMPKMNGFDCCAKLREICDSRILPILMITGLDDKSSVDWAFKAGASDYVTKPIHWPVLFQRVHLLLENAYLFKKLNKVNQQLEQLAITDELTGLDNRRSFNKNLVQEWNRLAREKQTLSFVLCDIDYFKKYNDAYGHLAGDLCLQQIATSLAESLRRPADSAARFGGEEFALILPNTTLDGARHVVANIQKKIAALGIKHNYSDSNELVSLSFGIASTIPSQSHSAEDLVRTADVLLYKAKESGRNTACFQFLESSTNKDLIAQLET